MLNSIYFQQTSLIYVVQMFVSVSFTKQKQMSVIVLKSLQKWIERCDEMKDASLWKRSKLEL